MTGGFTNEVEGCRQVEQFVANYRRTRQLLDEIAAINLELLRRREPID